MVSVAGDPAISSIALLGKAFYLLDLTSQQPVKSIHHIFSGEGDDFGLNFGFFGGFLDFGHFFLVCAQGGAHGVAPHGEDDLSVAVLRNLGVYAAGLGFRAVADGDGLGGALGNGVGPNTVTVARACHGIGFSDLELFHSDFPFCPLGCPVLFYGLIIYSITVEINRHNQQSNTVDFVQCVYCNTVTKYDTM